jgi:hypothetical protein
VCVNFAYWGRVRRLSRLRGRIWTWYHLLSIHLRGYYAACLTLTYAPSHVWERRDISRFIEGLRAYYRRRGWQFVYFWVAELQQRGAVHYHVIVFIPRLHKLPKPDRWWKKGITHIFAVRHFAAYLTKYLQKGMEGSIRFPRGLRLFGYGGLDFLQKAMWRCRWLGRRWWERVYSVVRDIFYVVRLKGREVGVLTASGLRVTIIVGGVQDGSTTQGDNWTQGNCHAGERQDDP